MARGSACDRRQFLKAAVAAGGASALSACLDVNDDPVPTGVADPSQLPDRQHAWNDRVRTDEHGNVALPRHQLLLYLSLPGAGPPTATDRAVLGEFLETLDRAYERSNEGLLYSIGYSPAYFDRFDAPLPQSIDLPPPRRLSPFEDPTFDTQDGLMHLASDRADVILAVEQALTGERERVNGFTLETPLVDVFENIERRSGFVGPGMPADRQDVAGIPESKPVPEAAPLFMGFEAGFEGNQATEANVTIEAGPFAGGTTKHVSRLRQRLDDWYDEQNFEQRVMELFSPAHAEQDLVDGVGDNLGTDSGLTQAMIDSVREHARTHGRVGHAQKAARANRDEAGTVRLLRRHVESTDGDVAALHFPSLQRGISAFEEVRRAMNGTDLTDEPAIGQRVNNGILEYIFTTHRGNFLVPPRRHRVFPTPRPG